MVCQTLYIKTRLKRIFGKRSLLKTLVHTHRHTHIHTLTSILKLFPMDIIKYEQLLDYYTDIGTIKSRLNNTHSVMSELDIMYTDLLLMLRKSKWFVNEDANLILYKKLETSCRNCILVILVKKYRTRFITRVLKESRQHNFVDSILRIEFHNLCCNFNLSHLDRKCNKPVSKTDCLKGERYCKMHRPAMKFTEFTLLHHLIPELTKIIFSYM